MRRIGDWVSGAMQWLAVAALAAMMVNLGADILLRNLAGRPLDGTLEIVAEVYMPFVVFAALAATHLKSEEIRVDLIAGFLSPGVMRWIDRMGQLLMIASALAMAWLTGKHAVHAFEIGEHIEAGAVLIAGWPGKAIVTLGFALLAIAALVRLLENTDDGSI